MFIKNFLRSTCFSLLASSIAFAGNELDDFDNCPQLWGYYGCIDGNTRSSISITKSKNSGVDIYKVYSEGSHLVDIPLNNSLGSNNKNFAICQGDSIRQEVLNGTTLLRFEWVKESSGLLLRARRFRNRELVESQTATCSEN